MNNIKVFVSELPNTNWNDPQVILMFLTLMSTMVFSYLLYQTSKQSTKVAKESLEYAKSIGRLEIEQKEVLKRMKRKEIEKDIIDIHKNLFSLSSSFASSWTTELQSIKRPTAEELSMNYNEKEIRLIEGIFDDLNEYKQRNLIGRNGNYKSVFDGNELKNLMSDSNEYLRKINEKYFELIDLTK